MIYLLKIIREPLKLFLQFSFQSQKEISKFRQRRVKLLKLENAPTMLPFQMKIAISDENLLLSYISIWYFSLK
jgi:hypothetical protein